MLKYHENLRLFQAAVWLRWLAIIIIRFVGLTMLFLTIVQAARFAAFVMQYMKSEFFSSMFSDPQFGANLAGIVPLLISFFLLARTRQIVTFLVPMPLSQCSTCGYFLAGASGTKCPECGELHLLIHPNNANATVTPKHELRTGCVSHPPS
jgi:phage FluMu protein Com